MSFDNVHGQEQAKRLIRAAMERKRLAHGYLFTGPDGVGKTLFAQEVAKALLCRGPGVPPCDTCRDCHMVEHDRHPDLLLVEAEIKTGASKNDQDRETVSRVIKLKQIAPRPEEEGQNVIEFLTFRPVQAARRVVIIREAERMQEAAQNALLKTLEEPSPFGTLILTSASARSLLPTIRSRCQEVRFAPLSDDQLRRILSRQPELEEDEIRAAIRFAGGSASRAIEVVESGGLEIQKVVLERVFALPEGDSFEISDDVIEWAKSASRQFEPQRERVRQFLHMLVCAYRDLLVGRVGGPTEASLDRKDPGAPRPAASRLAAGGILRVQEALWEARRQTDANAALDLVLQNLFERIACLQQAA